MRLLLVGICLAAACADKTPASIEVKPSGTTISSSSETPLSVSVRNTKGEPILDAMYAVAAEPSDVVAVTQSKGLRCVKSGDVTVTISSGTLSKRESFRCRLVDALKTPNAIELIIPNAPVQPAIFVLDSHNENLADVVPTIQVADASLVAVDGRRLRPLKVGTTSITVTAGDKRADVPVTVVQKVESEPLLLNDGTRRSATLGQGKYRVEIRVKSASGNSDGATLKWVGGKDCQDHAEGQAFLSECEIENAGSVVVENPTTFGLGPAVDGLWTVYRVP